MYGFMPQQEEMNPVPYGKQIMPQQNHFGMNGVFSGGSTGYGGGAAQQWDQFGQQQQQQYSQGPYPGASEGHTSVKVHAPPGGKSSFAIGGGNFAEQPEENIYAHRKM